MEAGPIDALTREPSAPRRATGSLWERNGPDDFASAAPHIPAEITVGPGHWIVGIVGHSWGDQRVAAEYAG